MGSGFVFDGKLKDLKAKEINEHIFAREALPNTSLGKAIRNEHEHLRASANRYELNSNDASYLITGNRPSETIHHEPNLIRSSASYVLSRTEHLESNVDHWMGNISTDNDESRRESTVGLQHPSLASANSGTLASLWYILSMLPMIGVSSTVGGSPVRRCCSIRTSIISILSCLDLCASHFKQMVARARARVAHLTTEQIFHKLFSVGMNVVIALHAIIFLVLTVYQDMAFAELSSF